MRLIGLTWGPEDLSAELGAEANRNTQGELTEPYRLARSICLYAAAAAKLPAIETVYVDFRNSEGLRRDTEAARRDGFTGRLAIHPAQVPVINEIFTPSAAQIERAKAVVAAFAAQPGAGTVGIDGKMITARTSRVRRLCWGVTNHHRLGFKFTLSINYLTSPIAYLGTLGVRAGVSLSKDCAVLALAHSVKRPFQGRASIHARLSYLAIVPPSSLMKRPPGVRPAPDVSDVRGIEEIFFGSLLAANDPPKGVYS